MEKATSAEDVRSSRVIRVVFLALLLDLLGFTLILPLLPSILDHYSQTGDGVYQSLQSIVDWFRGAVGVPMETKYNSVLFGGLIGSLYSFLQFLSSPITGALSDEYGRKPLLLLTTVGLMASYILWALSHSFTVFLLSRVVGGICKGNVSLCTAVVADLPCPKARNKGMAMIGVAFSLGFTLGPLMGAYFALRLRDAEMFYQGPAVLAVLFSLADLLFIFFTLPETLQKDSKGSSESLGVQQSGDLLYPVALFKLFSSFQALLALLLADWNCLEFDTTLLWLIFILICCCYSSPVPLSASVWTWLSQPEGNSNGDPSESWSFSSCTWAYCGFFGVLAGWSGILLYNQLSILCSASDFTAQTAKTEAGMIPGV